MGKFDQVLLISDYDNTLVYTRDCFDLGTPTPPVPPYNVERLRYFMANGGTFAVVTGRCWQLMRKFLAEIPTNAPCGIGNGAGIIDPATGDFLYRRLLPDDVLERVEEVHRAFPDMTCELFRADHCSDAFHPIPYTYRHAKGGCYTFREIPRLTDTVLPLIKVLFEGEAEELAEIARFVEAQSWYERYEIVFSGSHLLELVARGGNKGILALEMAKLCGKDPAHLYCVGDHLNDIPMLQCAREGFAPSNAVDAVKAIATTVGHCSDGAVGQVVDILDKRYPG